MTKENECPVPGCCFTCDGKTVREAFFNSVSKERTRQDKKHGDGKPQFNTLPEWMMILAEERGERCKEANEVHFRDKDTDELLRELVHEAAVALAIYEAIKEGRVYRHKTLDDPQNCSESK